VTPQALPFGVYILARAADWDNAQQLGYWHTASLEKEGFIHAASHEQVPAVFARRFSDAAQVFLLKLDEAALVDYLRWDPHPVSSELFPHIATPIPLECIERVLRWPV
jgi:uncharacterized protein (DUF952 family)